jgi:hypothetical protein
VQEDSTAYLDTRYNLQTHDGATIYLQTRGVRKGPKEILDNLGNDTSITADQYSCVLLSSARCCESELMGRMRLQCTFETGDERYKWINKEVVIASSARCGDQGE